MTFKRVTDEHLCGDVSVTYDYTAKAGYINVDPTPDKFGMVAFTEALGDGVHVDLDVDGQILGVETMHEPSMFDLVLVLRRCRLAAE